MFFEICVGFHSTCFILPPFLCCLLPVIPLVTYLLSVIYLYERFTVSIIYYTTHNRGGGGVKVKRLHENSI